MADLVWPDAPHCHDGDWHAQRFGPQTWQERAGRLHCSYCGSLHPKELLEMFDGVEPQPRPPIPEPSADTTVGEAKAALDAHFEAMRHWKGLDGADWKYGWPHKFYLVPGHAKFYSQHLADLDGEAFDRVAAVIVAFGRVEFSKDDQGRLGYRVGSGAM